MAKKEFLHRLQNIRNDLWALPVSQYRDTTAERETIQQIVTLVNGKLSKLS